MKRIMVLLVALFFMFGCAATLSMKGVDGSTMTLSNYAVTEVYSDGVLTQRIMVPDNSWFAGILDKVVSLWNSVAGMIGGTTKTAAPIVSSGK